MKWLALLATLTMGCVTTVYTVAGRCPEWSEDAIKEFAASIERGDSKALEEAIGRQELYCQAVEPKATTCEGWGCWWYNWWHYD